MDHTYNKQVLAKAVALAFASEHAGVGLSAQRTKCEHTEEIRWRVKLGVDFGMTIVDSQDNYRVLGPVKAIDTILGCWDAGWDELH